MFRGSRSLLGSRGSFLNYAEAHRHVKREGLQSYAEWIDYATSAKPSFIPRNPADFYRNKGWTGYPDFLGYEKKKVKISCQPSQNLSGSQFASRDVVRLCEMLEENDTDFEMRYLPPRMGAHVAIRHRVSSPADKWLFVRVASEHKSTPFRFSSSNATGDYVVLLVAQDGEAFSILQRDQVVPRSKCHPFFVEDSSFSGSTRQQIAGQFRELCVGGQFCNDFWEGLSSLHTKGPYKSNLQSLYDMDKTLCIPAGLFLRFPSPNDENDRIASYLLDDRRCIHRTATSLRGPAGYFVALYHGGPGGDIRYFSREDNFHEMIISIYDNGELQGVFVFSKDEIMQIVEEGRGGHTSYLSLYTPQSKPERRRTKAKQERQSENYIDLSTPEARETGVKRFQERMCNVQDAQNGRDDDRGSKIDIARKI